MKRILRVQVGVHITQAQIDVKGRFSGTVPLTVIRIQASQHVIPTACRRGRALKVQRLLRSVVPPEPVGLSNLWAAAMKYRFMRIQVVNFKN